MNLHPIKTLRADIKERRHLVAQSDKLITFWESQIHKLEAPHFPQHGVDYYSETSGPTPTQLHDVGMSFVGRYLGGSRSKDLSRDEIAHLHDNNLSVMFFYEDSSEAATGGLAAGRADAVIAREQAYALGAPAGTVVYMTVDYEPTDFDPVIRYLLGAKQLLDQHGYQCGVYGGFETVTRALDSGIGFACQTLAWSAGRWQARAQVRQYRIGVQLFGKEVDDLVAVSEFGGWS